MNRPLKHLCVAMAGMLVFLGWPLAAQEIARGEWPPPRPGPGTPPPPTFSFNLTSPVAQIEAIVRYGLSLPDPPPMWLPPDFHRTADRYGWSQRGMQMLAAEVAKPVPRLASGRPDLSGAWAGCEARGCPGYRGAPQEPPASSTGQRPEPTADQKAFAIGLATIQRPLNWPIYRNNGDAEKQKVLWRFNIYSDPAYKCMLTGVPRIASPAFVVQTDKEITFMYVGRADSNTWRVVPIGGQFPADVRPTPYGHSVGHWEGDTLVVEVRNLDADTWFGEYGLFHGKNMTVTERYYRVGDILVYQAKVEDPDLLAEPYFSTPRFNVRAKGPVVEAERCVQAASDLHRLEVYPFNFFPEGNLPVN